MQERDEAAQSLLQRLANRSGELGAVIAERLVSFIDFRDIGKGMRHSNLRERVDWYERLVGAAKKVKVYPPVPAQTMAGLSAWLFRQVSAGLSLYAEYMGGDIGALEELLEEGRKKQKPRHRAMLGAAG